MKKMKKNALTIALTLAVGMCSVNVAAVNVDNRVAVSEGQMIVSGSLTSMTESSVNCIVIPKGSNKTDLESTLYIKEGKTAQDGSFKFDFVFDEKIARGEYTVRVSDGEGSVSEFDFTYYPYEDMIDKIQNTANASEFEAILTDKDNRGVLGFLGIDTSLLENSVVNSKTLIESLFTEVKNNNLSFDETVGLYVKMTALEFINDNQRGWLEKFSPEFDGEIFSDIKSAEKKQWLEDNVYKKIKYASIASLEDKYEELSILYLISNSGANELGGLIEKYKDKLEIIGTNYYNSYSKMTQPQKIIFASEYAKTIKAESIFTYSEFRQSFEQAVTDAVKNNSSGNGSSGGSSSGGNISIGYNNPVANNTGADASKGRFLDSAAFDWAKPYIEYLADKNIISGFEDGTFRPNDSVTREQFVKMIVTAFNFKASGNSEISFSDVKLDDWCYDYISTAYENGIINGVSSELFGVGRYITREDAATILNRAAKEKINGDLPIKNAYKFSDDGLISDYAKASVYSMYHAGIINGTGNDMFAPKDYCTRAQTAKMIYYLITKGE